MMWNKMWNQVEPSVLCEDNHDEQLPATLVAVQTRTLHTVTRDEILLHVTNFYYTLSILITRSRFLLHVTNSYYTLSILITRSLLHALDSYYT